MYAPGLRPRRLAAAFNVAAVLGRTDTDQGSRVRPRVVPVGRPPGPLPGVFGDFTASYS